MNATLAPQWMRAYEEISDQLPQKAAGAAVTMCGMSACVDARADMHNAAALLEASAPAGAVALANLLKDRVARGIGGEVRVNWPDGSAWLTERMPIRYALGGTGPHAAWVLTAIGAPALLALEDRSAHMLAQLPSGVLLAKGEEVVPADRIAPLGEPRPDVFTFEYTAGRPVGDIVPSRSSRIIVRFHDQGLERDAAFERLTPQLAHSAGAGLVAGFTCEPPERLDAAIERVFALTRSWRKAGLETIHLEQAGYASQNALHRVLAAVPGAVTSIGMSHSELLAADAVGGRPLEAMIRLGERLGVDRVCVHADHWAAAVTLGDPERERRALMTGCLVAGSRAAAGKPVLPRGLNPQACLHELPFATTTHQGAWSFVACASPYLERPATTLGLGDSFTAGCLLALGRQISQPGVLREGMSRGMSKGEERRCSP
jgi:ADP-dependent phosphofructokinase/glucokinase